jgi:hypothetical protein
MNSGRNCESRDKVIDTTYPSWTWITEQSNPLASKVPLMPTSAMERSNTHSVSCVVKAGIIGDRDRMSF